jgi:hypothetical protein
MKLNRFQSQISIQTAMKLLIIFTVLLTLASAQLDFEKRFQEFRAKFKKNYEGLKNMTDTGLKFYGNLR